MGLNNLKLLRLQFSHWLWKRPNLKQYLDMLLDYQWHHQP